MNGIRAENLSYAYSVGKNGERAAISDLTVGFSAGEFNVLVGYSGCGKTTLLKIIAGLIDDYDGELYIGDENAADLTIGQRGVSFVAQDFTLYPHLTIFDNIAFPLRTEKLPREVIVERVLWFADKLGIKHCLTRKPKNISIGQQQRAAIARALVKKPEICLLDEPFSNVDPLLRAEARAMLKKVLKETGCTVVYVTHDLNEAVSLADKLFVMDNGSLAVGGDPKAVYNSDNAVVRALKGL